MAIQITAGDLLWYQVEDAMQGEVSAQIGEAPGNWGEFVFAKGNSQKTEK